MASKKKKVDKKSKITAMIPDKLISDIRKYTPAQNTTQSIVYVLEDWLRKQKVNKIFDRIEKEPLEFLYSAEEIRELNRKVT